MGVVALLVSSCSFLALSGGQAAAGGAVPTGGQFSAGSGSISSTANGVSINQSSSRGIVNWQSFSIGQGNAVNIANGSGATLNRVTGTGISTIAGSLTSTGSVYLINPAGVVVTPTGQVITTGSFVASTRDVVDSGFMAGGTLKFAGASSGTAVNQGSITSSNGDVVLIGQSVSNSGRISAPNGMAALAAGDDVLLRQGGDQAVLINAGTGNVTNSGTIAATQAQLAAADGNVYALAVNNGGVIRATGTTTANGHVYLTADDGDVTVAGKVAATNADGSGGTVKATAGSVSGILTVTGTVSASAKGKTAKGGAVTLTAATVNVGATAQVSADGGSDGGTVLIGGDRHGGSTPSQNFSSTPVANATTTTVAAGASISASGGAGGGNGGNVVVWSNQSTSFAGAIAAKGGASGGNGGFVEVSGEQVLSFTGTVDTSAALGITGTLLLDPADVTIYSVTDTSSPAPTSSGETQSSGTFTPTAGTSYILNTDIDTALATNNVTINTGSIGDGLSGTGSIHFGTIGNNNTNTSYLNAAPIHWSSANSLTLNAVGVIDMPGGAPNSTTGGAATSTSADPNASTAVIDSQGGGAIIFNAGGNGLPTQTSPTSGEIAIPIDANIEAHGGTISFNATQPGLAVEVANGYIVSNTTDYGAGTISITADYTRLGSGSFSGLLTTTGDVYILPYSAGAVTVGNDSSNNYNSPNNTALIDKKSISLITAANLVIGSSTLTTDMTIETTHTPLDINAPNVGNLEFVTNSSGSITQNPDTVIMVKGGAGGLAASTGGAVTLVNPLNQFDALAVKAGGNIAVEGNSTASSSGTLSIGTVNDVSGVTTTGTGATTTLINSGAVIQDTASALNLISTPNLVLEGGGSFTLNNLSNAVANVAGSVSSLIFTDASALSTASLSDDLSTPTTYNGISASGAVTVIGDQSVTIGSGAPVATTGGNVMVEAGTAAGGTVTADSGFVNDDGASAFNVTGGGTWRVYSQDPRDNALGGLTSANYSFVQYDAPNSYGAPGAATTFTNATNALNTAASGNGFLYGVAPTVTTTITNAFTKVYDGTTTLPGSGLVPLSYGPAVIKVNGAAVTNLGSGTPDTVTLNQSATLSLPAANFYPNKDVGTYTIGVSGVSLQSATDSAGVTVYGYNVTPAATGTAMITPKPLTVTGLAANNKTYDATAIATLTGTASLQTSETAGSGTTSDGKPYTGDSVTLSGTPIGTFSQSNVGNSLAVSVSGLSLVNNTAGDYTLPSIMGLMADITPAPLTVTGIKVYDATTGFVTNQLSVTGGVASQTVALTAGTGTSSGSDVSTYAGSALSGLAVSVTGGSGNDNASNYQLPTTGTLSITPAPLTVTGIKVYDGTTGFVTNQLSVTGGVAGQTVALTAGTGTSSSPNVNTYPGSTLSSLAVSVTGGSGNDLATNYQLPTTGTLTITPEPLTITATSQTKVYDGTVTSTATPTLTSGTLENGDTLTALTQAYASRNVLGMNGSTLNVTGYMLTDASNYAVTTVSAMGTITAEPVTVTAVMTSKTYDGTTSSPGTPAVTSGTIYSPDTGSFTQSYGTANVGTGLTLTPAGSIADGNGGGNYTVTYVPVMTGVITAEPLTITATSQTKVYDGTVTSTATPTLTSGTLENGDTLTAPTQAYASRNVLGMNGSTLNVTGYMLTDPSNYVVTTVSAMGTITAEPVTVTAVMTSKTYDGTTSSPGTPAVTSGTIYSPDTGSFTQSYGTANVGTGLTLTPAGSIADGNGGMNYTVTYVPVMTGVITAEPLTITATSQTKVYDGTVTSTATPTLTSGTLENGDTLTALTQAYASRNVLGMNGSTLNVTGYMLTDASNYAVTTVSAMGTITAEPVTVTAVMTSKTYDGTTSSPGTPAVTSGTIYSPDTGSFTQSYGTANVGTGLTLTPAGSIADGNGGMNYTVTYVPVMTGVITAEPLTITATSQTKVYDGTVTSTATPTLTSGTLENGDTLTALTQAYASRNVLGMNGSTLNVTGYMLTDASNYAVTTVSAMGTITAEPVTVTAVMTSKTYDGTTSSPGTPAVTSGTIYSPDTGSFTQSYGTANVGTGLTLTPAGSIADGNGGMNYTVTYVPVMTGVITAEPLTITATSQTKVYDGTVTSTATPTLTSGTLENGDTLTALTQAYASRNVLGMNGSTLNVTGYMLTDASNYAVTTVSAMGTITAEPVTVTAVMTSKTYDGTTSSPGTPAVTSGTIYSPDTGSFTQSYNTANVGTGLTLTPAGSITDGNGGMNYTVTYVPVMTGVITAEPLTITATSQTKVYDGTVTSTATPTLTSGTLENGDTLTALTQAYASRNVLGMNGSTLNVTGYMLTDASNYAVTTVSAMGTITAEPVTVTAVMTSKTYDGTTSSPGTPAVTSGTIYSPDTGSFTQSYGTANVGTGLTLTPAGSIADGNGGGNYTVTYVPVMTGVITAEPLTITATSQTKVYDGTVTSTATPTLTSGTLENGDTLTALTQAYASRNVLGMNGSTLNVTGYMLTDASNYAVTTVSAMGTITAEPVTVTAVMTSKTYDGTTSSPGTPAVTSGTIYSPDTGSFTQSYGTANVGTGLTLTPAGSIADGNGGGNYTVTYVPVMTGVITAEPLTITATSQTKVYDGTVTSTATPTLTSGTLENGDTLTALTQAYASRNVLGMNGSTLNVTGYMLTDASNYAVTTVSAMGTITAEPVTVTAVMTSKTYDGTTSSPGTPAVTSGTIYGPDTGSFTQSYGTANVGTGLTLTPAGSIADGNGGGNYTVTYVPVMTGVITAEPLTITATSQTKVYDGTVTSTATPTLTSGTLENGDTLTAPTQAYASRNVLGMNGSTLNVTGYMLTDPSNYVVTTVSAMGTITAEPLTVTAVPTSKTYDGTPGSPGTPTVTSGTIYGPDTGTFTQTYDTPNAGTGLTLTPTGTLTDGNGGNNYAVTYVPVNTGIITPEGLTISATPQTKVYDGTTVSTSIPTLTSGTLENGDTLTNLTQAYASRNVLGMNGSTLNVTNYMLTDSSNYTVTTAPEPGTITAEPLTVTAAPTSKTYDGTAGSPGTPTVISGTIYGPDTGTFTQTYNTPNAGTNLTLTPTGTLTDGNGGNNYAVTYVPVTTGIIAPEPLTVTAGSQTKVYDGTTVSAGTPTLTSGTLENGDTLTSLTQAYASKNVLGTNGSTINVTGYTLTDASNYTVTEASAAGTIAPLTIVVTGTRVYDAATDAASAILTITNVIPGDSVALGSGAGIIASKNVGPEAVTGAGTLALANNGAGDYTLAGLTGTVTVTPLSVTVSGTRVYDGATDAASPILTIAGNLDGANLTLSGTGTLVSRNVGSETIASLGTLTLGGGVAGNYALSGVVVTITPEPLTVTAVPTSKTYNGTTGSPGSPMVTTGTVYGPDTGNFTEAYNTPNAGTGLTLTPSGSVNDGNDGKNYTVTYAPVSTGVISPRPVVLVGTRPFDSSVNAPAAILTIADVVPGDTVGIAGGTGILVAPFAGIEPLTGFGTLTLAGPSAGNYTFTGGAGLVVVTSGVPFSFPPLDSTDSGIGLGPFTDAIFDGGILHLKPRQNGIVTGTIATIDGIDESPDTVLACTMGSQDTACLQNGVAPAPNNSPAQAN